MSGLVMDGTCIYCGKPIHETCPWQWMHTKGRYHCNDQDITSRDYAAPDRETTQKAQERRRS